MSKKGDGGFVSLTERMTFDRVKHAKKARMAPRDHVYRLVQKGVKIRKDAPLGVCRN